jgi:putative membrane protein
MSKYATLAAALIVFGSASAAQAKSDTSFLTDVIQINLAEIALGDLAQKNGGSDDVKAFGKMLVEDHTASNEKAKSLAQANDVALPSESKPADQKLQEGLAELSGREFDRQFAKAMVKGHKEAIAEFESAAKGEDDAAKFAQATLPTLQKHLEQAQSIERTENAAKDTSPNEPGAQSERASTEMIRNLPGEVLPLSEYYNQSVYDNRDNKIGDVNDLLLDKSGKIKAVIIGVGGILGVGEKNIAVPFSSLKIAEKKGERYLVLETTKEALQTAPGYIYDRSKKVWMPAT